MQKFYSILYIFSAVIYYFYTGLLITNYCTIIFVCPTCFGCNHSAIIREQREYRVGTCELQTGLLKPGISSHMLESRMTQMFGNRF
jgi:hypothetical protein